MGVTLEQIMASRMAKRQTKIRNDAGGQGQVSCSAEGFAIRMNLATSFRRSTENFVSPVSCSGELCAVHVIPAVDVAVVQVKAARRCWAWGTGRQRS
jgi:hypothetical protein